MADFTSIIDKLCDHPEGASYDSILNELDTMNDTKVLYVASLAAERAHGAGLVVKQAQKTEVKCLIAANIIQTYVKDRGLY